MGFDDYWLFETYSLKYNNKKSPWTETVAAWKEGKFSIKFEVHIRKWQIEVHNDMKMNGVRCGSLKFEVAEADICL